MINQKEKIRREVRQKAAEMGETMVDCSVEDGRVILDGTVSSDEQSYLLEDAVRRLPDVESVENNLMVEAFTAEVEDVAEGVDLFPDFSAEVGSGNVMEAGAEAEPYFPATDPVVEPDDSSDGVEIVGGFDQSAGEDAVRASLPQSGIPQGDDEIREGVIAALRSDAATTDLDIDVSVVDRVVFLRGTVSSLEEADLAESVASRVPGIEEVREELNIAGM